ncbi:hypothetical protein [Couchioplanes azureus]|uniref:hypothetical protein n=1 Tax=Couchioplanes caeruleus TaxID=56438 RepID=UPI0016714DF5|nr:hypothetical protein [Couchioplanes caeruleus]GGQ74726.1 hypothetical protein GCM10010166_50830 [Couchioplanes caeruleus subsp. azureus]
MELILDLRQGQHQPVDTSARGQVVQPYHIEAVAGRTPGAPAMGFDGRRSRIVVPPSPEFRRLGGIRVTSSVWVDRVRGRHTIVEGYLAFALFIDPDRSLGGTVYDGIDWGGVQSEPDAVPLGRWIRIVFTYDGIDTCTLSIDDRRCAAEYSPLGRVQGVEWPYGVNVGAWPDADKRVFAGRMQELALWRSVGGDPGTLG